ncbi:hypothetical protein CON06_10125 [Bacillus cereus]|nr:hypothetical protein CON06_10125 [Bacillus cereus]
MMCFEEKEMNCKYKGVAVCSEGCKKDIENLGIEKLITKKEEDLKRFKRDLIFYQSEKPRTGITFENIEYGGRTKEEIDQDAEETRVNIPILEEQIELLKKHSDVRLKYLF